MRIDRVLRAVALVPVVAVAASLAIAVVAWALSFTARGEREIHAFVERALGDAMPEADVTIGAVDVAWSGAIELRDVRISVDGATFAAARTIRLEVEPFSLLGGALRVPVAELAGAQIDATADWARVAPPPSDGPGLRIVAGDVRIDDVTVALAGATIDGIAARAAVETEPLRVRVDGVRARWRERDLAVEAAGAAAESDGGWVVTGAAVRARGATVAVPRAAVDAAGGVAALAQVDAPAAAVGALADALGAPAWAARWRGDAAIDVAVARDGAAGPWRVTAVGRAGGAALAAAAAGRPGQWDAPGTEARVRIDELSPAALWGGAPEGRAAVRLTARPGHARVEVAGALAGVPVHRAVVDAAGDLDAADIDVTATTATGPIEAHAHLARDDGGRIAIRRGRLRGDVAALARATGRVAAGRMWIEARAAGPVDDVRVDAGVEADDVAAAGVRARSVRATVTAAHVAATGPWRPIAARVDVRADEVDLRGHAVRTAAVRADVRDDGRRLAVDASIRGYRGVDAARAKVAVSRSESAVRVVIDELWIATGTLTWTGRGGRVRVDTAGAGRVRVEGVTLASPAGAIAASGVLGATGRRRGEGALTLAIDDLDLARARPTLAAFGFAQPIAGEVAARADLRRRGRALAVDARAELRRFAWRPGVRPAHAVAVVRVADGVGHVEVDVAPVRGRARVSARGEVAAPADPLDVDAWAAAGADAVRSASVDVVGVTGALVGDMTGWTVPADGRVDARIAYTAVADGAAADAGPAADIAIAATRVRTPWASRLGATWRGRWGAQGLAGAFELAVAGATAARGDVSVAVPLEDVWRRAGAALAGAPVAGHVVADAFDLRRLADAGVVAVPISGHVTARASVAGTVAAPVVTVDRVAGDDIAVAGVPVPAVTATGSWQRGEIRASVRARQPAGGSLVADGVYRPGAPAVVQGSLAAVSVDLSFLRALSREPTDLFAEIGGRVDADVRVDGSLPWPALHGDVRARDVALLVEGGARRLDGGRVALELHGDRAQVRELTVRSGDGVLAIDGAVRRAGWTFAGRAVAERFPVVAGPYIATVDATATLAGAWRGDRVGATVTVHGGRVRLADTGRELHDTGPLEDVVYVDRLGDRPEQEEDAGPTRIELAIATAEPVRVASPEADARVRADLTARIGDGLDWLAGRVWVVDGTVVLFEREYDIARAEARFAGPTPIDPDLDIELRRAFPAAVVSIFVSDRLSDPRVRFASDVPEYDDVQILSIILGQDPDEANNSTLPPEQRAANAVGGVLAGTVRDTLRLPIDVIRRHPDGWEVGKFLFGGRVLVGYRTRDGSDPSANLNEVTIEWRLRRNVVVEAFWGDEEAGAADILYVIRL